MPAGALVGALVGAAAAALAGRRLGAPQPIYLSLLALMGAATGATVTPDALRAAAIWPLSLLALILATALLTLAGYLVFRKVAGLDRATAFYAAAPGALSSVLALAPDAGADMAKVAAAQTLRLTALAAVAPLALAGAHAAPVAHAPVGLTGELGWILTGVACAFGWAAAERFRLPSPAFLGPLLGSALVHGAGLTGVSLPEPLLLAVMAGLGALVGARFGGTDPKALLRFLPACLLALAVMGGIGLIGGAIAGRLAGVGPGPGMLAFAPGGMETMVAIALALGAQPAYVAAHHTFRFLALVAVLPWLDRRIRTPGD